MAWEYSEKTQQLFLDAVHGKPGTHLGEIEDPDGVGEHGSIACGDSMRFFFRVDKHATDPTKDVITTAKYLTFGCTSAIAASEALCSMIEAGRYTPINALKISNEDIVEFLGGLPEQKIHCSVMGAEALESAVFNWAQRRGVDLQSLGIDLLANEQEEGRIVGEHASSTGGDGIGELVGLYPIPGVEHETALGHQHAGHLAVGVGAVGEEHHPELADDSVERGVGEGQCHGVG